jgi:hypothetical protein
VVDDLLCGRDVPNVGQGSTFASVQMPLADVRYNIDAQPEDVALNGDAQLSRMALRVRIQLV